MKSASKSRKTEIPAGRPFGRHGEGDSRRTAGGTPALPLSGLRILVGRARHQASALSSGLRDLGAEVLEVPFIEIRKPSSYRPLDTALKSLHQNQWLILTSTNGVDAVAKRMKELRISNKNLQHLKVAAIGPATKKAIEQ